MIACWSWRAPGLAAIADTLWPPRCAARRLVLIAFVAPLILPVFAAMLAQGRDRIALGDVRDDAAAASVLLSSPLLSVTRRAASALLAAAIALPVLMVLAAPVIAIVIHREGVPNYATHYRLLAQAVDTSLARDDRRAAALRRQLHQHRQWRVVLSAGPSLDARHRRSGSTPWSTRRASTRAGIALVCPEPEAICMHLAQRSVRATCRATP